MNEQYDVVVVGGRCAGAATAMLLARNGVRVLVVEAARPGTDTLSTHALMRGGVLQLHRWGLLDAISAAAPAIVTTEFAYGDDVETVAIRPSAEVPALYAPRRQVLDWLLLDAARAAGAEVRIPARVTTVLTDGGRVCGVEGVQHGRTFRATAALTIGADGRNSTVAAAVGAPIIKRGNNSGAIVYGYFAGLPSDRYHWSYRPGATAGVVPTGDGLACVWAGTASNRLRPSADAFYPLLTRAAPDVARRIGSPVGALRGYPGQPGWVRASSGPGWALVGDAGYFKDPITAHGITDALRDAELLARAVIASPDSLGSYEHTRNLLSESLFDVTDRIAGYGWDLPELRGLLLELSDAMRPEVEALQALDALPVA